MITALRVRNFQSLAHVDLDLAPLTVIVGPSSSGKSALVRALRTLTSNARGTGYVSTWATRTVIEADLADAPPSDGPEPRGTVRLTRGSKADDNAYEILPPPGIHEDAPATTFTKLGGTVPPEVTEFLRIAPHDRLILASQFDKPFLLDDSPTEVAHTLAALTGVHVVFAAARAAKTERLRTTATAKTRRDDLAATTLALDEFATLPDDLATHERTEADLASAVALAAKIENLADALASLRASADLMAASAPIAHTTIPTLASLRATAARADALRSILATAAGHHRDALAHRDAAAHGPELRSAVAAHSEAARRAERREAYSGTLRRLRDAVAALHGADSALSTATAALDQAHAAHHGALTAAGHCPVCGQDTTGLPPVSVGPATPV